MNKTTEELIEQELAKYEDAWQEEIKQAKIFEEEDAKLKLTQSLWDKNVEKINVRTLARGGKAGDVIGILDEEGNIIEVIEQKEEIPVELKTMTEKEEKYLRKTILDLCYQGIKTLDYFIEKYPDVYLTKVEQVKKAFYELTYYFD